MAMEEPLLARVGELVVAHPQAAGIFQRHGIDPIRTGGRPLLEVCTAKELDAEAILREVAVAEHHAAHIGRWRHASLRELTDHIVSRWHTPLRAALVHIALVVRQLEEAQPDNDALARVGRAVRALREDLLPHMEQEENVLFPWILQGRGPSAGGSITALRLEHDGLFHRLDEVRHTMKVCLVGDRGDPTQVALWRALAHFDVDLVEHVALEEFVLFPRALGGGG